MPHFTSFDGAQLEYFDEGAGPAVVLLHGLGTPARLNFGPPLPAFKDRVSSDVGIIDVLVQRGLRVIGLDCRGHGGSSDAGPGPYPEHTAERDVYALLDHLSIASAAVLGYSLGGLIAAQLLCARDPRITAIVLGGIGHHIVEGERLDLAGDMWPQGLPRDGTYAGYLRLIADAADAPDASNDPLVVGAINLLQALGGNLSAVSALLRSVAAAPVTPAALAKATFPVLVIHGHDELTHMDRFDAYLPHAKRVVTAGDHGTAPFQADFQQAVADFLTSA